MISLLVFSFQVLYRTTMRWARWQRFKQWTGFKSGPKGSKFSSNDPGILENPTEQTCQIETVLFIQKTVHHFQQKYDFLSAKIIIPKIVGQNVHPKKLFFLWDDTFYKIQIRLKNWHTSNGVRRFWSKNCPAVTVFRHKMAALRSGWKKNCVQLCSDQKAPIVAESGWKWLK